MTDAAEAIERAARINPRAWMVMRVGHQDRGPRATVPGLLRFFCRIQAAMGLISGSPGRNRHLLMGALRLIWGPAVLPAAPTNWDGAVEVIRRIGEQLPWLAKVGADSAYWAETLAAWIRSNPRWVLEVVKRRPGQKKFEVRKWRWTVDRTSGWFGRSRRLSQGYEHIPRSSEAWISIAMIQQMSRFSLPEKNSDDDLLRRPSKRMKT